MFLLSSNTLAQSIPIKTVPLASGDQFLLIPGATLGMGNVTIAVDDSLGDPFINPGKGRMIRNPRLFAASSFYSISGDNGSGRTLPLGATFRLGNWYAGGAAAIQQLIPATPVFSGGEWGSGRIPQSPFRGELPDNRYGALVLGRSLADGRLSLGASISGAELEGVEGVEFLYANSVGLKQSGWLFDYRLGMEGELSGNRRFEASLFYSELRMKHDFTYVTWVWDEDDPYAGPLEVRNIQRNLDYTNTTGIHLGYTQPMIDERWRIGWIITGNWKTHPKIPEYVLPDMIPVPKDPGNSWAYNLGVGFCEVEGPATLGIDIVYEPIWTETWGEASEPTYASGGVTIPVGGKTIENDYLFNNLVFRIGLDRKRPDSSFQLGLELRSVQYKLNQIDNIEGTSRVQHEHWMEWTPTWGGTLDFPEFQIRYIGRLTFGTGRPGEEEDGFWIDPRSPGQVGDAAIDYLPTPTGDLVLQDATVMTHQISLVIPLDF